MKRIYFFALIMCLAISANAQILNPGFENWTSGNPDNWWTSNVLVNVVTQTTDKHSGNYALKGEVLSYQSVNIPPQVISGSSIAQGFSISQRYTSLDLYYKFSPLNGDKFFVDVVMYKDSNAIGAGATVQTTTVSSYTKLSVPIYYSSNDVPNKTIISFGIQGPSGSDYSVGTAMYVDDLAFGTSNGINNLTGKSPDKKSYPNPCNESIFIPLNNVYSGNIDIIDMLGKTIKTTLIGSQVANNQFIKLSVSDLPAGIYYYIVNGNNTNYKDKFIVVR
ncbi:MAG: T9SS type A sorting domain-containing protein [Bacteroidota bacterium]|nr:T9SS type A sorting domain-containing protein [Bacteroidota bacterium]